MTKISGGSPGRTYACPRTVAVIGRDAFSNMKHLVSIRLNEGLEVLEEYCFRCSEIRRLALPSSVWSIGAGAFSECTHLAYADLSAAHGLKCLASQAFMWCRNLRRVLLNDGLEIIRGQCFNSCGMEEIAIPSSVRQVDFYAFRSESLKRVRFLGIDNSRPVQESQTDSPSCVRGDS